MKIKPLDFTVLVKRDKPADRTASGIILTVKKEEMEKGKVLSVGKDVKDIKKGNNILFKNYALDIIEIDGEEQTFIKRENILAIVE